MRTLVPADSLVYLETNDLAAALQPIVESKPFTEAAKKKPDFSALKGVQIAVAITGFETSEEKLTDENSVGRVQPHFVAVADTHAWNYQAVAFAEQKLGGFVESIYDSEPKLEKTDAKGGKYFTWTAEDNRKAYALVIDSLVYFSNDESAIDKCLAVRRGETDNIAKTGKVKPSEPGTLASGYVSTDGVAQIANIAALKFASETSDESEVQSAVAGILPQFIRGMMLEVNWTMAQGENGILDRYEIVMPAEMANVFSETMQPADKTDSGLFEYVPADLPRLTVYDLKNGQVAWRSVLLAAQKQTDPLSGKIVGEISNLLFEPYGVSDVETFLSGVDTTVVTAALDADGERPVMIVRVKDRSKVTASLSKDLKPPKPPAAGAETEIEIWTGEDGDISAAFIGDIVIVGDTELVKKCVSADRSTAEQRKTALQKHFGNARNSVKTVGQDPQSALKLMSMLAEESQGEPQTLSPYTTETRFTRSGMERMTTSSFGLIGSIVTQLDPD